MKEHYDSCVIGGGFYGCCLSLWLKEHTGSVLLLEKEDRLLSRASAINQARVHTGFHYPRSMTTAIRSLINMPRFVLQFRKAIVDDFTMLYAIARKGSKVNAARFWRMFKEMNAPIQPANSRQRAIFAHDMIEDIFAVQEYAFDHNILHDILINLLYSKGIETAYTTKAIAVRKNGSRIDIELNNGKNITVKNVFNCTYSCINMLLEKSGLSLLNLKHELTEMALVAPPSILDGLAVTVMDGPFFSIMPYPAQNAYTLSHVRYTPHMEWNDTSPCIDPHIIIKKLSPESYYIYMERDAKRYIPDLEIVKKQSLFEIKTVLIKNEQDDGRPILFIKHPEIGNMYTIMGSKIDNVYDLLDTMNNISNNL